MARIVRTRSARSDIASIAWYIAQDSPAAADRWLDELDATLSLLSQYPAIGEQIERLVPGLRRHCVGIYLVFYRPLDDGIELRRVLHGARRIEDLSL